MSSVNSKTVRQAQEILARNGVGVPPVLRSSSDPLPAPLHVASRFVSSYEPRENSLKSLEQALESMGVHVQRELVRKQLSGESIPMKPLQAYSPAIPRKNDTVLEPLKRLLADMKSDAQMVSNSTRIKLLDKSVDEILEGSKSSFGRSNTVRNRVSQPLDESSNIVDILPISEPKPMARYRSSSTTAGSNSMEETDRKKPSQYNSNRIIGMSRADSIMSQRSQPTPSPWASSKTSNPRVPPRSNSQAKYDTGINRMSSQSNEQTNINTGENHRISVGGPILTRSRTAREEADSTVTALVLPQGPRMKKSDLMNLSFVTAKTRKTAVAYRRTYEGS